MMFRKDCTELRDHITKKMAPLIVKRFEFIPTTPGSDWRDLPNWAGELSDGTRIRKLEYRFHDNQQVMTMIMMTMMTMMTIMMVMMNMIIVIMMMMIMIMIIIILMMMTC